MISIGDVLEITGKDAEAIEYYQQAFEAMTRVYTQQTARAKPWQADLGAIIGDKYLALEQSQEAEIWYRRVLSFAVFNLRATRGLSGILRRSGNTEDANRLCTEFFERIVTPI